MPASAERSVCAGVGREWGREWRLTCHMSGPLLAPSSRSVHGSEMRPLRLDRQAGVGDSNEAGSTHTRVRVWWVGADCSRARPLSTSDAQRAEST